MPFSYKEWLENFLFPTLKRQGINVTLENDGSIVCEKNGYKQVTPKEAAEMDEIIKSYKIQ